MRINVSVGLGALAFQARHRRLLTIEDQLTGKKHG